MKTVDLHEQLKRIQRKHPEEEVLNEVRDILHQEEKREALIKRNLHNGGGAGEIDESCLDKGQIFTLDQIERLCVRYRLRFLDSRHFKGEIPQEAIQKIKQLENQQKQPLSGFKIIAPKELFRLSDKDSDPILMLPLKGDRFYFIHKWGGEISAWRSILAFPMRNFMSMFWFLAAVAVIFSLLVPTPSWDEFAFLVVHSFIAICGMTCLLVFTMRENFSNAEWDSKYFS